MKKKGEKSESESESESEQSSEEGFAMDLNKIKAIREKGQRNSVSAEVFGQFNQLPKYSPDLKQKDPQEEARLLNRLEASWMFKHLDSEAKGKLVQVMQHKHYCQGQVVIQQGQDGHHLFIVDTGELDCQKVMQGDTLPTFLKTYVAGEVFGELALLYNSPRQATITARTSAALFLLDRVSFKHIVQQATVTRRDKYEQFLSQVSILSTLDPYERIQICDVVQQQQFADKALICQQGSIQHTFYILLKGHAQARKNNQVVMEYKPGDYFGELALLKDIPRQADVVAIGDDVSVLWIDKDSFQRLFGPLQEILNKNTERYSKCM